MFAAQVHLPAVLQHKRSSISDPHKNKPANCILEQRALAVRHAMGGLRVCAWGVSMEIVGNLYPTKQTVK